MAMGRPGNRLAEKKPRDAGRGAPYVISPGQVAAMYSSVSKSRVSKGRT